MHIHFADPGGIIIALMMGCVVANLDNFFEKHIPEVIQLLFSASHRDFVRTEHENSTGMPAGGWSQTRRFPEPLRKHQSDCRRACGHQRAEPDGAYKCFAPGKTLAKGRSTPPEHFDQPRCGQRPPKFKKQDTLWGCPLRVPKVAVALFGEKKSASLCAMVVRLWRTIRRSLHTKCL